MRVILKSFVTDLREKPPGQNFNKIGAYDFFYFLRQKAKFLKEE